MRCSFLAPILSLLAILHNIHFASSAEVENDIFTRVDSPSSRIDSSSRSSSSSGSLTQEDSLEVNKQKTANLQSLILGGKPGVDFPNFVRPPRTKFRCRDMDHDGMFADLETNCQSNHTCMSRRQYTFICPTGTLFNQALMTCDYWFNVNCADATRFYSVNIDVFNSFQPRSQPSTTARPRSIPSPSTPRVSRRTTFNGNTIATPASTSTTTTSTTARPFTRSVTSTRRPTQPVYVPPRLSTTRAPTTAFDDDGPDWVYAWLKDNLNATTSNRRGKQMSLSDLPLLVDSMPKTETAFDFLMDNENIDKTKLRTSFDFKINHQRPNDKFSRAFEGAQPKFVARAHNELVAETGNHPSPWQFPLDPNAATAAAKNATQV